MSIVMLEPLEWDKRFVQSILGDWFGKAKAYINGGPCYVFANTLYCNSEEDARKELELSIKAVEELL